MQKTILTLSLLLMGLTSLAQTAKVPIKTDRPDQTESPSTTPPRYFQIEMGGLFENTRSNATLTEHNFLMPTILAKYGLSRNVEFRLITELGGNGQMIKGAKDRFTSGLKPIIIGFKANLFKENRKKFIPKTSFIGHLGISRLASDFYEPSRSFPQFRFLMEHTLTSKTSLGYNLGMEWNGQSNNPATIYTATLARDLGKGFGGFAEFYGYFTRNDIPKEIIGDHRFDAGLTYLLNNDFQFDVSGGIGLTENAPDFFLSAGISFRFR
jgi:hypothetical protein